MGTLVNHTIPNLSGGVSQQFDEAVFEVQVRDMVNCIPTISRGVLRRNPIENGTLLSTLLTASDYYVYAYDRGTANEQYAFLIGNGHWRVINTTTNVLISYGTSSYLNLGVGISPKDAFSLVTIGDFTFISNKYVKTALSATVDGTVDSHKTTGVYWVKRTSQVVTSTNVSTGVAVLEGYKYGLNGQETWANRSATADNLRGEQLATDLATKLGYSSSGVYVYKTAMLSSAAWEWYDSSGNEASFGFKGEVRRSDLLPDKMPSALNGTVVNITQDTASATDDYWMTYTGTTWIETRKPGMQNTLAANTMPHVFIRGSDNAFYFKEYTTTDVSTVPGAATDVGWTTRQVGDEVSAPAPSFVGDYISQIFFHKNRLGFISRDTISLSGNGDYGTFFNTTIRSIPDTDPIDLTIATTDVSYINYAVSTNSALILFANDAQFVLSSGNQPLTPISANIEVVSRYVCSNKSQPRAIGNKVFFVSESGGYSQLFMYNVTEGLQQTEATNLSQHIPSYLPKNIRYLVGHSVLGYTFMWSEDTPTKVYIYNQSIIGGQMAQSAFHIWEFPYSVVGINIINNTLVMILRDSITTNYYSGTINLELPGSITNKVYTDTINSGTHDYVSSLEFSKWFIKDGNNNGTKTGRLQIRTIEYTMNKNSFFTTKIVTDDGVVSTDLGLWEDVGVWVDTNIWTDGILYYTVTLDNNPLVHVMGNSETTNIIFSSDRVNTTKGFELSTIAYEGFFHQRSRRF